jgi:O-antigen/teichoic acid export membrane protein
VSVGPPQTVADRVEAVAAPSSFMASLQGTAAGVLRTTGSFSYGFVAQSCSAATNFALMIIAARALGPAGLGTIAVGFAAYLLLLGFARGLVTNPLIAGSASRSSAERAETARSALTVTLAAGLPAAGILAAIGAAAPAQYGRGVLVFAPWLVPTLVQDLGRSIVFRDRRGKITALSDATWLLTMAAVAPLAFTTDTEWAVVGCWGVGAVGGAAIALRQIRCLPAPLGAALRWWKSEAWPFGRWLLLGGTLYGVASYTTVLALAGILGTSDFGGLRAVQSAFAPLTLIGPAIALPGLPLIARASPRRALAITWQLAGVAMLVTIVYLLVVYAFPGLLPFLFGRDFGRFRSIMVPIGIAQLFAAPGFCLALFLTARQRGRTLVWVATLNVCLAMAFSIVFAAFFGLKGAAWAGVVASALGLLVSVVAIRQPQKALR